MRITIPTPQDFLGGIKLDYCTIETKIEQLSFSYYTVPGHFDIPDNIIELRYTFNFQGKPMYLYVTLKCSSWSFNVNSSEFVVYRPYIVQINAESNIYYGLNIDRSFIEKANELLYTESSLQNVMRIVNLYLETFIGGNHNNIDKQKIIEYFTKHKSLFEKKDKMDAELYRIKHDFEFPV